MDTEKIQSLLSEVKRISDFYEKIANMTGENFNIFQTLKLTTDEVRTHSAFIAELLNPNGSHGQKEDFLELFTIQMKIKDFINKDAKVKVEHHIDFKTETTGGRIDILITDTKGRHIIIENKIYADDQENQLIRYHNFDKEAPILYLTLDGKDAEDYTKSSKNLSIPEDLLRSVSYKDDIKIWLEKCKEKATDHPILRETIKQYIYLIKDLTNQSSNLEMEKELIKLLLISRANIESALEISKAIEPLKKALLLGFAETLLGVFNNKEVIICKDEINKNFNNCTLIQYNVLTEQSKYKYFFRLRHMKNDGLYIQFSAEEDGNPKVAKNTIFDPVFKVFSEKGFLRTNWSIAWKRPNQELYFDKLDKQTFNILTDKNKENEYIQNLLNECIGFIDIFSKEIHKL